MKSSGDGIRLSGLCLSALCAPGLSLILVLIWALGAALFETASPANEVRTSLEFAIQTLVALLALMAMVTLWGLIPSLLFGAMGCWLAERTLRSGGWWMWGLAGLLTAGAYVVTAVVGSRLSGAFSLLFSPWLFLTEQGRAFNEAPGWPWDPTLGGVVAAILAAGFLAGSLYFRLRRAGPPSKRADKRA
jgi:hypothetical protein